MIILKHLTVERFRLLRQMDLHFPQRGSILIQGPNEAGKSALLESIYFALYGESLMFDQDKRSLDDLISYGASDARVTLTVSVGTTELTITRVLERGQGQHVTLRSHRLGKPEEEPITRLGSANERIITEFGHMDGNALRNSCLLEQKGLDRLEHLRGSERESTVRKLLGLERLHHIGEQFKVTPHDEWLMEDCIQRLRLAEIQERIPIQSKQLETLEVALDAVSVAENLTEITTQEADITEQELALEDIHTHRAELKSRQGRVQQLKRADATLGEIVSAYDTMAEARRELPILERQIADLERHEQEELPMLEKRVNELVELTKSFGTLQRMSTDLLTTLDMIKDLEQDLKHQSEGEEDLKGIEVEVEHARRRVAQAQKALEEMEEHQRTDRPVLEARLESIKMLASRLTALRQLEEQYAAHVASRKRVDESEAQLRKVLHDLYETEQELVQAESEAKQVQLQAETLEKRNRQLSIRRELEEWQRLKGLSQALSNAEQHVHAAHDQQASLTETALKARSHTTTFMGILIVCSALFLLTGVGLIVEVTQHAPIVAVIFGVLALLLGAGAVLSFQNYTKARAKEQAIETQVQEAVSRVRLSVDERETAIRMGGNHEALEKVERGLRTLTGTIPESIEEAQSLLQQTQESQGENIANLQDLIKEKRDEVNAARNRANVIMDAIANLRQQRTQLEEQKNSLNILEEQLRDDQMALGRLHQEITLLAGQEGLPQSSINERLQSGSVFDAYAAVPLTPVLWNHEENTGGIGIPDLDALVESTLKAIEHEIASLEGKADAVTVLTNQVKIHQDTLDVMVTRKRIVEERNARYQTNSPAQQIAQAREQQNDLRNALQSLQESLRQRVKPLGIVFGQTEISNAETNARKQLEELNVILGGKFALQSQHTMYTTLLKERQESLAEHYKQLAKFSNSLGSWIVPLNPFAEALVALRTRCQQELGEANEDMISKELDRLHAQEGAVEAKMALCRQEIEDAQERIATTLVKRNRPQAQAYTLTNIVAIWPLVSDYSSQDRVRLEEELSTTERDLENMEQEELALGTQLQTDGVTLDLALTRAHMEQQERSFQVKKLSGLLIKAVHDRLMRKIVPRTEYYMQHILPLLTSGRYHDVRVTTYEEEGTLSGGPLQLKVWDSGAGEYVSKAALSGGVADQLSLALRLGFAVATLPKELGASPGFLCLDEPLSSFDQGRTKALMDVVTGDILGQHFEQVLLISHSRAFDPALFPYHVYMDNGTIVESNLPVVPAPQQTVSVITEQEPENSEEDNKQDMTVRVPAIVAARIAAE
ncbi:MAG: hypothetical protein NVSMB49_22080 [Ktedonobacteraceae bacterium]